MKTKKGELSFNLVIGTLLIFGAIALIISISAYAFSNLKDTQTGNSTEYNITDTGSQITEIAAQLLPGAGIIIGVIFVIILIVLFVRMMAGR